MIRMNPGYFLFTRASTFRFQHTCCLTPPPKHTHASPHPRIVVMPAVRSLQISGHQCFHAMMGYCSGYSYLSCNQFLCLFFTPTLSRFCPSGGAAVQKSLPCSLTHANSCAVAWLSLLDLSGVYHACIPRGAMRGLAHPGCTPPPLLHPPHPLPNLPPTPLATAFVLPLCLNGKSTPGW